MLGDVDEDSEPKTLVDGGRACNESGDGWEEETCWSDVEVEAADDVEESEGKSESRELASLSSM